MSGFLSRWSRRKGAAAVTPVDEASLPKLETLTGDSDITAFLAAGVSQALQSQALRIAWKADPRIAGFRGMADYDWDFNADGYGRLAVVDDVAMLLQRFTPAEVTPMPAVASPQPALPPPPQPPPVVVAEETAPPPAIHRHGGALPA